MDITLRPLSLGEILDRTFQLYRARFLMFVGIATFAAAIDLVWRAFQTAGIHALAVRHVAPNSLVIVTGLSSLVSIGVTLVALAVTLAATTRAVSALYLGAKTGIARAYSEVWPHWFRYVWVNFTAFFLAWLPAVLVLACILAVAAIPHLAIWGRALVFALMGFTMLIVGPLGIWMMLRYSLANAASVFENIGVRKSLRRSVTLSKTTRGRIFVMLLVVSVAQMMLGLVLLAPELSILLVPHGGRFGQLLLLVTIYNLAVGFVSNSLCMPIYGIALTLFYYDARIRKEGFDVEWMLERSIQASNTPQTAPVPQAGFGSE